MKAAGNDGIPRPVAPCVGAEPQEESGSGAGTLEGGKELRSLAKGSTWSESEGNGISPLLSILGFVAGVSFRGWGDAQEAQDRTGSRSGGTHRYHPGLLSYFPFLKDTGCTPATALSPHSWRKELTLPSPVIFLFPSHS